MSMGGLSNLGGSVFTLKVDDDQFTAGLKKAEAGAKLASDKIGGDLTRSTKMATQGFLQLGYAVDDLQYGFSAIANNIPQIAMGFGATAGIAGAAAIAATAINQLIKHWGELSDIAQSAWSGGSIEQLHQIREAAEQAAEAFDKLTKEHTKSVEAAGKFTHESIVEGPVGKILEGLAAGIATDPGQRSEMTERQKLALRLAPNAMERTLTEGKIRGELDEENRRKAREMLVAMDKPGEPGRIARETAHRFAQANPGAFPSGFAAKLDPEAAEADRVHRANIEADIQGNKNIRAAEKSAEHEKIEANKRLTEQGIHFEEQGKREQLEAEKKAAMEAIRRGEHVLSPQARGQLQDMLLGGQTPHQSQLLSTKAFIDKTLTSGMNAVPQKQLDELKGMHDNLKSIDKKIADLGRLG